MPRTVDVRSHQFQLAVEAAVLVLAAFTRAWPIIPVLMVLMAVGLFRVLFQSVLAPRLGPTRRTEDARLPRFATAVGLVFMATVTLLFLVGQSDEASGLAAGTALVALAGAVSGWCLPCETLMLLARLRLINPDVPIACPAPVRAPAEEG